VIVYVVAEIVDVALPDIAPLLVLNVNPNPVIAGLIPKVIGAVPPLAVTGMKPVSFTPAVTVREEITCVVVNDCDIDNKITLPVVRLYKSEALTNNNASVATVAVPVINPVLVLNDNPAGTGALKGSNEYVIGANP
jgi:hypothetical protein